MAATGIFFGGGVSGRVSMLVVYSPLLVFLTERSLKPSGARAWAWGLKCDLISVLYGVHLLLISCHRWLCGCIVVGGGQYRDRDGSRVGKKRSQVALDGRVIRRRNVRRQVVLKVGLGRRR